MKKTLFLTAIALLIAVLAHAKNSPNQDPTVTSRHITKKVIVLNVESPSTNNIIAINTEKGIVVIDTEVSPTLAGLIKEKIVEEFGNSKIQYVINTHSHGDHTWGNQIFKDATIIGHTNCLNEMANIEEELKSEITQYESSIARMEARLDTIDVESEIAKRLKKSVNRLKFILNGYTQNFIPTRPTLLFNDSLKLDLGDITLELSYYGKAHSGSDILIFCPEEKLLLTGDVFIHRMNPSYCKTLNLTELPRWISNLENIKANSTNIQHIIPGHNDQQLDIEDFTNTLDYLKSQAKTILDKQSLLPIFQNLLDSLGVDAAIKTVVEFKNKQEEYFILEADFLSQGYFFLYRKQDSKSAVAIFKIITELFPNSWNAFDCLGEAYMEQGDTGNARISYQKSLALNPQNDNAKETLERLGSKD